MNILMREIRQCMSDLTETDEGKLIARFVFPEDFTGFQGHFPDRPVLPGICEIQAVTAILETWHKKRVRLKEIVLAKFFSPVSCGEELVFECQEQLENGKETMVKALITTGGKKIAKLQLRVSLEEEK
jgi:3-hydroxyacyl-[acyl-carrier-protein] dehydratase